MTWIKFDKFNPPPCGRYLVVKTYADAPFVNEGYDDDKEFWITPIIQIDYLTLSWDLGGRVTHYMELPELPLGHFNSKTADFE